MITAKETGFAISALRDERYARAQAALKRIVRILVRKYHVSKVILIGSLAEKQRFGFHSDIDVCVQGIPDRQYFSAVGELLLAAGEFDVDIIPFEGVPAAMMERIAKGEVLYEKR